MAPWLTVDTLAGSVPPGENYPVNVTFDATGVPAGEYGVNLVVVSNDPVTPSFSVPVTLTVSDVILSVEIDVTAGVALDEDNVLGSAVNATDGYDPDLDLIEPDPTPNNYVTAYFPHPEWGVPAGERFQTDIRAPFDPLIEERSWPFTVETDQLTTVTFTFTPSFDAASGWGLWLRDETTGETHDLFPALTYQFEPDPGVSRSFTIMVGPQVPLLEPTERLLAADWSLIGAPLVPPDGAGSWADVLLDDAPGAVHLFGYEGLAGYAEVGPEEPVVQGQGLWVAATESFVWTMEGTMDTDGVAVPLLEGWTLVGYPLWLEGNLAGVLVDHAGNLMTYTEAVSAGLVSGSVFDYENTTGGYVPVTDLQTWHGYWFAAYASDLTLQFDFQNMVGSDTTMVAIAAAKNGKDATGSSATGGPTGLSDAVKEAQVKSSSSNWEVTVRMGEGPFAVTFGMNEGATDGFDAAFDLPVPPVSPAGADFPEIVFSRPEWALSTGEKFSRDLISPTNELRLWPATIRRSEPGTVTLSWDSSSWPYERDYQVYLPAENRVVVSSMREQTSVELEITGGSLEVQFRTPGFATDVPWQTVGLNLRNMPNPFNPSTEFHFNLSRDAAVEVRIYNLRGALVRRLVGGVKTAGPVSLRWQGRDDQGAQVASGIYFYQLYLDGRREGHTGKMSLIK